jgi:hypothetical protein
MCGRPVSIVEIPAARRGVRVGGITQVQTYVRHSDRVGLVGPDAVDDACTREAE